MKIDILIDKLKEIKGSKLDDAVDRLHYIWSPLVLVFFVVSIGLQQTFKEPMVCKIDASFTSAWVTYVQNYCFITNTFSFPNSSTTKFNSFGKDERASVFYYQWVPYTLALQALSCYLPHLLYLILVERFAHGLKLQQIVELCHDYFSKSKKDQDEKIEELADGIHTYVNMKPKSLDRKTLGSTVAYAYIFTKLLAILNVVANILWLNHFVGNNTYDWAFSIIHDALNSVYWDQTGFFPRVTFCQVPFKSRGQTNHYVFQCLLVMNVFMEKVFVVAQLWFFVLLGVSLCNLILAIYQLFVNPKSRLDDLASPCFIEENDDYREKFTKKFMSLNGKLLIRFVEEHAGSDIAMRLVQSLAEKWEQQKEQTVFSLPPQLEEK